MGAEATGREIADQINAGLEEGGQGWVATVNEAVMQVLSVLSTGETLDGTSFDSAILGLLDKAFGTEWQAKWDEVKSKGQITWEDIGNAFSGMWSYISGLAGGIPGWFLQNVTIPLGNYFNNFDTNIQRDINTAIEAIKGGFRNMVDNIGTWVDTLINKVKQLLGLQEQARQYNVEDRPAGMSESDYVNTLLGSGVDLENINGRHATGLEYVPWDGYRAILHKGESVLTRAQAQNWREGNRVGSTPAISAADIANAVAAAVSGMRVVMDGESVGTIVAPYVSASQGESLRARRNTL